MAPWRCYGDAPLPSPAEALAEPLRAFPSWYLRMECAACGRERFLSETHMTLAGYGDQRLGDLVRRMRHDGCGGAPARVELVSEVPGVSGRPMRRVALVDRTGGPVPAA
jgi:hypothetical protein